MATPLHRAQSLTLAAALAFSAVFPACVPASREKQDAADYQKLWKTPEAFCPRYLSRHPNLDDISQKDVVAYGLTTCAERGYGMAVDPVRAAVWEKWAAEAGDPIAQERLTQLTSAGSGDDGKAGQSADNGRKQAKAGHRNDQYRSGMAKLATGQISDALRFLREAAGQGHEEACLQWARTWGELEELRKSAGKRAVPRPQNAASFVDLPLWEWVFEDVRKKMQREALNLFQRAAETGQAGAHFVLGQIYASDSRDGIFERSPEKAREHLTKAADMGLNDAKLCLANHLLKGDLGAKDAPRALELLEPLAKQEKLDAMVTLGGLLLHFEGTDPTVPADPVRGVSLLEKAAGQGHRDSMERLAKIYEGGWPGISPDPAKAIKWHKQAASHGSFHSALRLGRAYDKGELGESPSPEQAIPWYTRAWNTRSSSNDNRNLLLEGEIAWRLGAVWRRSNSLSFNDDRWRKAVDFLAMACDMMQSAGACHDWAEMLVREETYFRGERNHTTNVKFAASRAKKAPDNAMGECLRRRNIRFKDSPYPLPILNKSLEEQLRRCLKESGAYKSAYAVGAILLGLPGPWDEILPANGDVHLLTANFPIEDSAKAEWAKRVTANRRLMTAEDKRELMRLRGMARNDEEKAIAVELLNFASEKGVWEASRVLADLYARGEGVPKSPKDAARYRSLAKKQKKSAGK